MPSPRAFVISDTHFHHRNIIGHAGRPFASVEEMNRTMVEKWRAVVRKDDKVFHLGDVAMWKSHHYHIIGDLPGRKTLILGNHDTLPPEVYVTRSIGFEKVLSCYEGQGYVLTHVPVHESQLQRWGINVHGHIHQERIGKTYPSLPKFEWNEEAGCCFEVEGSIRPVFVPDERYRNVCVEQIDYSPVLLTEVLK